MRNNLNTTVFYPFPSLHLCLNASRTGHSGQRAHFNIPNIDIGACHLRFGLLSPTAHTHSHTHTDTHTHTLFFMQVVGTLMGQRSLVLCLWPCHRKHTEEKKHTVQWVEKTNTHTQA